MLSTLSEVLGILTMQINPQAHGYRRSFHREYSRVSYPQETCVH